eukprot:scaffold168029_cov13-Prasinocladus_malaysianus.AAC.1
MSVYSNRIRGAVCLASLNETSRPSVQEDFVASANTSARVVAIVVPGWPDAFWLSAVVRLSRQWR